MKTIRKEKLYWICQFGGWFLFALLEVVNYATLDGFRWGLVVNAIVSFSAAIVISHMYRLLLIRTGWLNLPLARLIPRGVAGVVVMTLIMTALNIPLDKYTYPVFGEIPITFGITMGYFFNIGKYVLLWSLTYHLFQYWERSLEAEKERYRLEAIMKENAYHNLKTQLNPHFLFNSLNSIRTLVDVNPDTAKSAITQLSGLLRSSLNTAKHKTVSLRDELQTVKDYLTIESIRFDDRLRTEFHVEDNTLDFQVPPLMLQTLVENAVKHGISSLKKGGIIEMRIHRNATMLHIDILNSGQYKPDHNGNGVGIENTRERLKLLYDDKALFAIGNKDASHVSTHIQLPL